MGLFDDQVLTMVEHPEANALLRDLQPLHDAATEAAADVMQVILKDGEWHDRHTLIKSIEGKVHHVNAVRFSVFRAIDAWLKSDHQTACPIKEIK